MKVAVPDPQHSPMLGQCASSQTVWRPLARTSRLTLVYSPMPGARTFSHRGLRPSGPQLPGERSSSSG